MHLFKLLPVDNNNRGHNDPADQMLGVGPDVLSELVRRIRVVVTIGLHPSVGTSAHHISLGCLVACL